VLMKHRVIAAVLVISAWAPSAICATGSGVPPNPNKFGPFKPIPLQSDNTGVLGDGGVQADGRRAFLLYNCSQCHGNAGTGGGRGANITPYNTGGLTYDQVYNVIMRGEPYGGMPSFANYVTPADIWNLYNYINGLSTNSTGVPPVGSPTFVNWWVQTPKY
jgi:mono/diheme cytochrome c family protein